MLQHPLTANQATLLAAIISAVVSLLVCLLYLKFGPNYKKQIADLASTLTKLLQEHSSIAEALGSISAAQTKAKWRPSARIESVPLNNFLILKSDREFKLEKLSLLSAAQNNEILTRFSLRECPSD